MTNLNNLLSRALLALALLAGATAAHANPTYHVALDTSAASGDGYLQIDFLPFLTSDVLTATISGLDGAFTGTPDLVNVNAPPDCVTLTRSGVPSKAPSRLLIVAVSTSLVPNGRKSICR